MHPPTEEQSAIIDFARHRTENLCVNALAGAAKTTTLEMICHAVDNIPILSLAFNKRIADELSKRLPAHVECRTFNSLGTEFGPKPAAADSPSNQTRCTPSPNG
jgi:F-box protein 18 (helicase)